MKYSFSKDSTNLIITLDTESGKYAPEVTSLNDPNITLENGSFWIYENGKFLRFLSFDQIITIDGVIPSNVDDAFTKLNTIINTLHLLASPKFKGTAVPTDTPTGTEDAFWIATQAGTYTNFGGVVVSANSRAEISRISGVFKISQTPLDLTTYQKTVDGNKINTWTAKSYLLGDQVNHLGKDWVSNAAIVAGDVPGTSSKWVDRLSALQSYVSPLLALKLNIESYRTVGSFSSFGIYDSNPNRKCIKDVPIDYANQKFIFINNIIGVDSRYLCFFDSSGEFISSKNIKSFQKTAIAIPSNATKFSFGIVTDNSDSATTNSLVNVFTGVLETDFVISEINTFPIYDASARIIFPLKTEVYNKNEVYGKQIFPYFSNSQITTDLMKQVGISVREIYVPDYSIAYDYLLSVFRYKQDLSGTITIDIRIAQVTKGTTTLIKYYQFSKTGTDAVNYNIGNGLQIISLSNGASMLLDWKGITSGLGYGGLLRSYLLSDLIGDISFNSVINLNTNFYNKTASDSRFALKTELGSNNLIYSKNESDANFASKSTTETQLSEHAENINTINSDVASTKSNIDLVKSKLDTLNTTPPTAGAMTGNNVFTGENSFVQPVKSVAAVNDDELIRQAEYKQTLNRFQDAADYGFSPSATSAVNTSALNSALLGGNKTLTISKPGTYLLNQTVYIDDNTEIIFGKGVYLKKDIGYGTVLVNRGALTRSINYNIKIIGCNIIVNGKELYYNPDNPLYGLRGHICFFHVNNLKIYDTKILDLSPNIWGIHVCTFNDLHIDGFEIKGAKDAIHLGRGKNFIIENGTCETFDDGVALNGHDYTSCNPEVGNIEDGIVRNITDLYKTPTTGFFSRLLIGAWVDWYSGIQLQKGDTVVYGGKTYRIEGTVGASYNSATFPTLPAGQNSVVATEGFTLILCSNDVVYSANIINVKYENIKGYSNRLTVKIEVDYGSAYNRSIHPNVLLVDYPFVDIKLKEVSSVVTSTLLYCPSNVGANIILDSCKTNSKLISSNSSKAKVIVNNCDFINSSVQVINMDGGDLILRDSITDKSSINIGIGINTRIRTTDNLSSMTNITPVKGDYITFNQIPKIYNGTNWVDQI